MTAVLAALDDSTAARPVFDVARRLAALLDAEVVAVHVREDGSGATAQAAAAAAGVPFVVRAVPSESVVEAVEIGRAHV